MNRPSLNEFPDAATINIVVRTNSRNGANKKRDSRAPSCELIIKLNLFCINKHPRLALQRAASKRLNLAEVITNWRRYVCTSAEEDCRQKIGESKEVEPGGPAGIPLPLFSNRLFCSLPLHPACSPSNRPFANQVNLHNEANLPALVLFVAGCCCLRRFRNDFKLKPGALL